ncbi:MAG: HEPN domain-containing protein [Moorellales bacterium]
MIGEVENWLAGSEYDLETARALLRSRRYLYAIYFAHLAVEKALKAAIVKHVGQPPPKSHNLVLLAKEARLEVGEEAASFLGELNAVAGTARYPEDIEKALSAYPGPVAKEYVKRARRMIRWIEQAARLRSEP